MSFVQLIEYETTQPEEIKRLEREWLRATEGRRTLRRSVVTRDRNNPDHYLSVAEFDSYEEAMRNSELPETQALAEQVAALCSTPPTFTDLDVVDVVEGVEAATG